MAEAGCRCRSPGADDGTVDNGTAAVWEKMAAQGWLGLHVPEADGGQGFALAELAVVLEELGAALMPGPVLPTLVASAVLARATPTPTCAAGCYPD